MRVSRTAVITLSVCMGISLQGAFAQPDPENVVVFSDGRRVAIQKAVASEAAPMAAFRQGTPYPNKAELIAQGVSFDDLPNLEEMVRNARVRQLGTEASPAYVIGYDIRVRNYTTTWPASAVVLIDAYDPSVGGRIGCSGFLISPDTVATAGHCVHDTGGWLSDFRVYPGFNNSALYGSCGSTWAASVVGWSVDGNPEYDFGVIKLNCNVGNTTGWFNLFWKPGESGMLGLPEAISGYPHDKGMSQQWQSHHKVVSCTERLLYVNNDAVEGQSGSPLWFDKPNKGPHAIGIYTRQGPNQQVATRINEEVFNVYQYWISQPK